MGNEQGKYHGPNPWDILQDTPERPNRGPVVHYHHVSGGRATGVLQPLLREQYEKGHRMLVLRKRPLCEHYFAVFCERAPEEGPQRWKHSVVSMWLHGQLQTQKKTTKKDIKRKLWVTDPHCLADVITRHTQNGERFVSVSMTNVKGSSVGAHYESRLPGAVNSVVCPFWEALQFDTQYTYLAIGLELFFEEPLQRSIAEKYIYHVASQPVTLYHTNRNKGDKFLGLYNVSTDWMAFFNEYLNKGWRLVDIYMDVRPPPPECSKRTMTRFQFKYESGRYTIKEIFWQPIDTNVLWIWEKPASRQHESAPLYEGKIVPFSFQLDKTNNSTTKKPPSMNWDDTIWDMGSRGWELATVVDIAGFRPAKPGSTTEMTVTSLLLFQRPLPPPGYSDIPAGSVSCSNAAVAQQPSAPPVEYI